MREEILRWLTMFIWGSTDELADAVGCHRTTALRHLWRLHREGLVGYRLVGRSPTVLYLWMLTTDGVYAVFPERHSHPGSEDHHVHDPQVRFRPAIHLRYSDDHAHPSHWHSRPGAADLFVKRAHLCRFLYPRAVHLLKGPGVRWHPDGIEAKLVSFRWLEQGRLVVAVGDYEGAIRIFFCWVPRELDAKMLNYRLDHRFDGLIIHPDSNGPHSHTVPGSRPDPDAAPRPSGYAYICEDLGALDLVRRVLDERVRGGATAHASIVFCLSDLQFWSRRGRVRPTTHNIWDPVRDVALRGPERLLTTLDKEGEQ